MSVTTAPEQTAIQAAGQQPLDVLDQLMKPEIQQSLTVLVDSLPKLAELVGVLTKAYDFAQSVATDKVLLNDFSQGIGEFVKPIQDKAKSIASAAIEAGERSNEEAAAPIGLFGMLKMLKDPEVQRTLRFAQSFLHILAERKQQG
ncbi:DUF1641 domain-containing protein [Paenibacillus cymbidii]|uniref:DUF1641 domain-containing protein n=1 Tax=Paenibacillus cymbidii TaxID=1639034 RepID=UPI001080F582|nr:DUF1641 domain-containing protein [Paenibacillus cymbidii]